MPGTCRLLLNQVKFVVLEMIAGLRDIKKLIFDQEHKILYMRCTQHEG